MDLTILGPAPYIHLHNSTRIARSRYAGSGKRVKLPRCPATFNELRAPNAPVLAGWGGGVGHPGPKYRAARKPGDRRDLHNTNPTRVHRRIAVRKSLLFLLLVSPVLALAANFTVHVTDPSGSAVAGARVTLYRASNNAQVSGANSGPDGAATFHN